MLGVGVDHGFRAVGLERMLSCNIWVRAGRTVTQGQQITTLVVMGHERSEIGGTELSFFGLCHLPSFTVAIKLILIDLAGKYTSGPSHMGFTKVADETHQPGLEKVTGSNALHSPKAVVHRDSKTSHATIGGGNERL